MHDIEGGMAVRQVAFTPLEVHEQVGLVICQRHSQLVEKYKSLNKMCCVARNAR